MSSFVIQNTRMFDGQEELPANASILVSNGVITEISLSSIVPSDPTIPILSYPNHTLLPGLIDAHMHADRGLVEALTQSLKFGVTTVLDMMVEDHHASKLRKLAAGDKSLHADFKSATLAATISGGWPLCAVEQFNDNAESASETATWPRLSTSADVDTFISQRLAAGADYIKLFHESGSALDSTVLPAPRLAPIDLQAQLIARAHASGLLCVAHAFGREDAIAILGAGVDGMAHLSFDKPANEELVQAYKQGRGGKGAWCTPTLATVASLTGEGRAEGERYARDERVGRLVEGREKENLCACMGVAGEGTTVENAYLGVRMLKAAGVHVLAGTDASSACLGLTWGATLHHELRLFVERCGFSPIEALRSATSLTAMNFGLSDRGRIAKGMKADLLLVEGNPLEGIDDTLNIRAVWRDGVLCLTYSD